MKGLTEFLSDLFSSTEFSERELPELLGAGAGFDLPTTFQSCVMVSIALSAILIISSFWESLHVEPPAAILNEGWQLLKGFQTVCNCVWDLLRNSCTGKNNS